MTHACSECGGSGLQAACDGGLRAAIHRMTGALANNEWAEHVRLGDEDVTALELEITRLVGENARLRALLNTPELKSFGDGVIREAAERKHSYAAALSSTSHGQGSASDGGQHGS